MKIKNILLVVTFFLGTIVNAQIFKINFSREGFEYNEARSNDYEDVYNADEYSTRLSISYSENNYDYYVKDIKNWKLGENVIVITNKEFRIDKQNYYCLIFEKVEDKEDKGDNEIYEYYFKQLDNKNVIHLNFNYFSVDREKFKGVALKAFLSAKLR